MEGVKTDKSTCRKCGAPLDIDGYCSYHQPTRTDTNREKEIKNNKKREKSGNINFLTVLGTVLAIVHISLNAVYILAEPFMSAEAIVLNHIIKVILAPVVSIMYLIGYRFKGFGFILSGAWLFISMVSYLTLSSSY